MDLLHVKPSKPMRNPQQPRAQKKHSAAKKSREGAQKPPLAKGRGKNPVVEVLDEETGPVALEVIDSSASEANSVSGHYSD
jgi:hypothetical protein